MSQFLDYVFSCMVYIDLHCMHLFPDCGFGSRQQTTLLTEPAIENLAMIELPSTEGVLPTKVIDSPPVAKFTHYGRL